MKKLILTKKKKPTLVLKRKPKKKLILTKKTKVIAPYAKRKRIA